MGHSKYKSSSGSCRQQPLLNDEERSRHGERVIETESLGRKGEKKSEREKEKKKTDWEGRRKRKNEREKDKRVRETERKKE